MIFTKSCVSLPGAILLPNGSILGGQNTPKTSPVGQNAFLDGPGEIPKTALAAKNHLLGSIPSLF